MMKRLLRISFSILIMLTAVMAYAGKPKNNSDDNEMRARKSNYIFLEALCKRQAGKSAEAIDLMHRAYDLDTTNYAAAMQLGLGYIATNDEDKGIYLMDKHFKARPENYYENFFYGNIASQMGKYDKAIEVWKKLLEIYPAKTELHFNLSRAYAARGDYKEAIESYNALEESMGIMAPITIYKMDLYLNLKDTVNTDLECKRLLDTAPSNVSYLILRGDMFMEISKPDSAIVYYNKALSIEPNEGILYLKRAKYYSTVNDSISYKKEIYSALRNESLDAQSKIEILKSYIEQTFNDASNMKDENKRQQVYDNTNELFNIIIANHPHEAEIHRLYARYLFVQQEYKKGAEEMSFALDLDPTKTDDWKQLMGAYIEDKDYKSAVKSADRAMEYNPDNLEIYQMVGLSYSTIEKYDEAIDVLQKALKKTTDIQIPERSDILGMIADVYAKYEKPDSAYAYYDRALEVLPNNTGVLNNYAYMLAEAGKDLDRAERMSAVAVKERPTSPTFLDTYAWIYFMKGDYKFAKIYIYQALEYDKEPTYELYDHIGDILFHLNEVDDAVKNWEKALELNADNELIMRKVRDKKYYKKQ